MCLRHSHLPPPLEAAALPHTHKEKPRTSTLAQETLTPPPPLSPPLSTPFSAVDADATTRPSAWRVMAAAACLLEVVRRRRKRGSMAFVFVRKWMTFFLFFSFPLFYLWIKNGVPGRRRRTGPAPGRGAAVGHVHSSGRVERGRNERERVASPRHPRLCGKETHPLPWSRPRARRAACASALGRASTRPLVCLHWTASPPLSSPQPHPSTPPHAVPFHAPRNGHLRRRRRRLG